MYLQLYSMININIFEMISQYTFPTITLRAINILNRNKTSPFLFVPVEDNINLHSKAMKTMIVGWTPLTMSALCLAEYEPTLSHLIAL